MLFIPSLLYVIADNNKILHYKAHVIHHALQVYKLLPCNRHSGIKMWDQYTLAHLLYATSFRKKLVKPFINERNNLDRGKSFLYLMHVLGRFIPLTDI